MFGLTGDVLDSLYGGPDRIPTRGMITATTGKGGLHNICLDKKLTFAEANILNISLINFLATSSFTFADSDRILVQCFMNLVVLTVIFLLWANNPVEKKIAVD